MSKLNIKHVQAQPAVIAAFIGRAIQYHVGKGRIKIDAVGMVQLTDAGKRHFKHGPRAHDPEDINAMQFAMSHGGKFNGVELEKADNWPFPFRVPAKFYVAGRKDSQSQFAVLMLS